MVRRVDFERDVLTGGCTLNDEQQAKYTHGHHESVLRSHQRRTAEDSAGYLLPHLGAGLSAARRRLWPRDNHRRPR